MAAEDVVVDTLRVDRALFDEIWAEWEAGYAGFIALRSGMPRERVDAHWRDVRECLADPRGCACWLVPVISGRRP